MDLYSLFERYQQGILTEKDILLHEHESYIRDWKNFNTPTSFPEKYEVEPRRQFKKRKRK